MRLISFHDRYNFILANNPEALEISDVFPDFSYAGWFVFAGLCDVFSTRKLRRVPDRPPVGGWTNKQSCEIRAITPGTAAFFVDTSSTGTNAYEKSLEPVFGANSKGKN